MSSYLALKLGYINKTHTHTHKVELKTLYFNRKLFLALLGDRFPYSFFAFNRRSENRAQVTSRASLGKPIVPIVVE